MKVSEMNPKTTVIGPADLLYVVDETFGSMKMEGSKFNQSVSSLINVSVDSINPEHLIIKINGV